MKKIIKDKKGFLFPVATIIFFMILAIIILVLLLWFGFKFTEPLTAFWTFLAKWWWAFAILLFLFTPLGRGITKFLFSKIGVKV